MVIRGKHPRVVAGQPAVAQTRPASAVLLVLGWIATLTAAIVLLLRAGEGALGPPPLTAFDALTAWVAAGDPLTVGFALLRLILLALAWYLLGATTIGALARVAHARRFVRLADLLTVAPVRRVLQGALGVGLATAAVSSVPGVHGVPASVQTTGAGVQVEEAAEVVRATDAQALAERAEVRSVTDALARPPLPRAAPSPEPPVHQPEADGSGRSRQPGGAVDGPRQPVVGPGAPSPLPAPSAPPEEQEQRALPHDRGGEGPGEPQDAGPAGEQGASGGIDGSRPPAVSPPGNAEADPRGGEGPTDGGHATDAGAAGAGAAEESEAHAGTDASEAEVDGANDGASSWRVAPGDHLWGIAEATLRSAEGGDADLVDERTVARYWLRLIEDNRDRLVDPSNPDLILPGQEFRLPEVASPPAAAE